MARKLLDIEGVPQLLKRLDEEPLLQKPVRKAFAKFGQAGKRAGKSAAPRLTGYVGSHIGYRVGGRKLPAYVAITASGRNKRGYRYVNWQEFARKSPNRLWLHRAIGAAWSAMGAALREEATEVERLFLAGRP